jgi:hypothetical protein
VRVVGDGKKASVDVAAVVKPLANPRAGLCVVKVDHADPMLKLLQHSHNLTRVNMLVNIVHDMGPGRLLKQGLQAVS